MLQAVVFDRMQVFFNYLTGMKQEFVTEKMCHQNCGVEHLSVEEAIAADESLLIYCKPVELYNILRRRAQDNVINPPFSYFLFYLIQESLYLVYFF